MSRFAVVAVTIVLPAPAIAEPVHLVCLGAGSANRVANTYAYASDNYGNSAWGQVVAQRAVPFDDQVNIELDDGVTGRIRVPRVMLPPIHGGSGGWFQIKNVERSETEITGVVQINFMNQPKLRLDRVSGRISLSGKAGDYTGECEPYDPSAAIKKF